LSAHANALALDPPRSFASEHEDAWLLKHVAGWATKRRGTFVVLGAANGVAGARTLLFERLGWRGVCVEADPLRFADLERNRPLCATRHAAVVGAEAPSSRVRFAYDATGAYKHLVAPSGGVVRGELAGRIVGAAAEDIFKLNADAKVAGVEPRFADADAVTVNGLVEEFGVKDVDLFVVDINGGVEVGVCGGGGWWGGGGGLGVAGGTGGVGL